MKNFCRFFPFYGAKHRSIGEYRPPQISTIVEPFAGSVAYGTRYYWLNVVISDIDPIIYGVWDYLIRATIADIKALPYGVVNIREIGDDICQEAKWLIGFWLQPGGQKPANRMSSRAALRPDTAWSKKTRDRTAEQAEYIKHWKIYNCSYEDLPNAYATWFVDPPYSTPAGRHYVFGSDGIDYKHLGEWCLERQGQVIVCEQQGADWLPFEYFGELHSSLTTVTKGRMSSEVVYNQFNGVAQSLEPV